VLVGVTEGLADGWSDGGEGVGVAKGWVGEGVSVGLGVAKTGASLTGDATAWGLTVADGLATFE